MLSGPQAVGLWNPALATQVPAAKQSAASGWPCGWRYNSFTGPPWGRRQGPPGSPSPPLALFIGDGQEVPSAVQVHQGPGMGEDMVSAHGPEHTTPDSPGMFPGDKGRMGRGVWAD